MDGERWQILAERVEDALQQAAAAPDAWLATVCSGGEELAAAQTLRRVAAGVDAWLEHWGGSAADDSETRAADAGEQRGHRQRAGGMLGHYELIEWIGAGGMGEVFRARDLALGRQAALKRLPRRFTPELRLRLLREADHSARLQHPAIATFYETGTDRGETFIAMEYVEGKTLRASLNEAPLSTSEALAITKCLLEALEHAHAAALLHCDVKPENIMITAAGSAKLLDFGLARPFIAPAAARAATPAAATTAGHRLAGTIGYMAPEQLLGEPLDERTDVFQVGVVLYEMLTGQRPFGGVSPLERLSAVLHRDADVDALRRCEIPHDLQTVLGRALAREPDRRYPSAGAFLRDLEELALGQVSTALPTLIAVADFDNAANDPEAAWIGGSTAERISAELARRTTVTVMAREKVVRASASIAQRGGPPGAVPLGLQLGCGWIVSGAIERSGAALTLTMHLHEVATGRVVATARAVGTDGDLFAMQEKLAADAAAALGLPPLIAASTANSRSIEAHELFSRARLLLDRLNKSSVEQALQLLERSVAIDPDYAPALAGLAWAYGFRSIATTEPADLDRAFQYAERAVAVDPRHADAHMWRGYALLRRNEYREAAAACARATALAPANSAAPYFGGSAQLFAGRAADALPMLQHALDLDPKVGMGWLALGAAHLSLQQLPGALSSFLRARDLEGQPVRFPTAGADAYVADVLRRQGELDEARRLALEGLESAERSDHAYRDFFRAHALVVLGRTALDQHDGAAARAAFGQVLAQAAGRPRTRSCGHLVVVALAGVARADRRPDGIAEAHRLFDTRERYNFEPFFGALEEQTAFELATATRTIGQAGSVRAEDPSS